MPSYSFGQSVNQSIPLALNNDQTVPRRTNAGRKTFHELEGNIITADDPRRLRAGGRTKWILEFSIVHTSNLKQTSFI